MFDLKFTPPLCKSLIAVALSFFALQSTPSFADSVVLTFSTVGDSRQDAYAPDNTVVNPEQNLLGNASVTAANVNVPNCPSTTTVTGLTPNPGLSGQDCKWLQNTTAWSRIIRTIQSQKANLLFFNGDMIMGYGLPDVPVTRAVSVSIPKPTTATPYPVDPAATEPAQALSVSSPTSISNIVTSDLVQIYQQYGFWRGMVANLMETGTYVVPVPGNHETQCKRCGKKSQWQNENAWRDNMGDLILDVTRLNNLLAPTGLSLNSSTWSTYTPPSNTASYNGGATNPDNIYTNQSQLSYSFDIGTNHFAVINTDPTGNDSHAPSYWLDNDLTTAVSKGAKNLFVFGHKPAYYYYYAGAAPSSSSSLYLADNTKGDYFWGVISKHHATYFTGHEHVYNVSQPVNNTTPTGGSAYQVIVGAGGSPFDDLLSAPGNPSPSTPDAVGTKDISQPTGTVTALASDRLYSWATVSIYASGKAQLTTYGFDPSLTGSLKTLGTFTLPAAQ